MFYTVHGLLIQSAVSLPELQSAVPGQPDLRIEIGEVPTSLRAPLLERPRVQISAHQFLMRSQEARFLIEDGQRVCVTQFAEEDEEAVRMFLMGTCMGAVLLQRGLLPVHANALCAPQGAVLVCGCSGSGKSTLAAALELAGYPLFSDDLCCLEVDRDVPVVRSGYPRLRLWADALERLGHSSKGLSRVRQGDDKFVLPRQPALMSVQPVCAIYLLSVGPEPGLASLQGLSRLTGLATHVYKCDVTRQRLVYPWLLPAVARLAAKVRVKVLRRSPQMDMSRLAGFIEEDLST